MVRRIGSVLPFVVLWAFGAGCGGGKVTTLVALPLDELSEIVEPADAGLWIDRENSADGRGSLCVDAKQPRVVRLCEVPVSVVTGREIACTARMRSLMLRGRAFPELWVRVPGHDELSARLPSGGVTRSRDEWVDVQAALVVEEGLAPDRVRVNLTIEAVGRVWIDDLKVTTGPPGHANQSRP